MLGIRARAAGGDADRSAFVVAQSKRRLLSALASVHDDIEDLAIRTPNELRLAISGPQMQSSDHAKGGTGHAVLDECAGVDTMLSCNFSADVR